MFILMRYKYFFGGVLRYPKNKIPSRIMSDFIERETMDDVGSHFVVYKLEKADYGIIFD